MGLIKFWKSINKTINNTKLNLLGSGVCIALAESFEIANTIREDFESFCINKQEVYYYYYSISGEKRLEGYWLGYLNEENLIKRKRLLRQFRIHAILTLKFTKY